MCRILNKFPGIAALALAALILASCDRRIYVQDGVTDGDRFSLPLFIEADNSPVTGSWVAYSIDRSFCQLEHGGENPARYASFDCELSARQSLIARWMEIGGTAVAGADDPDAAYLDAISLASDRGFLREYVWHYLRRKDWQRPDDLQLEAFTAWRREALTSHKVQTRIIGSWGFVNAEPS